MVQKTKQIRSFRITVEQNFRIAEAAEQVGISPSELVRRAAEGYLKQLETNGVYTPHLDRKEVILFG
jgi:hypothetical protein